MTTVTSLFLRCCTPSARPCDWRARGSSVGPCLTSRLRARSPSGTSEAWNSHDAERIEPLVTGGRRVARSGPAGAGARGRRGQRTSCVPLGVAAKDDPVDALALHFGEHGVERRNVGVHVVERSYTHVRSHSGRTLSGGIGSSNRSVLPRSATFAFHRSS